MSLFRNYLMRFYYYMPNKYSYPFYFVTYSIKLVTTSWTDSMYI